MGLPTARGSGTSGRVQSNNFILRPRPSPSSSRDPAAPVVARGGGGIREEMAEHERKRAMESRLLELREALEEQGYAEARRRRPERKSRDLATTICRFLISCIDLCHVLV